MIFLPYKQTTEAAFAKLSYVLGKDEWNLDEKKQMMQRNLRGEMGNVNHLNREE